MDLIRVVGAAMAATAVCCAPSALAQTFVVDARSNIFGAGHETPPNPLGTGAGVLPVRVALEALAGPALEFGGPSGGVSGQVRSHPLAAWNGPDGRSGRTTDVWSLGSVSGIVHENRVMFLAGVFLDEGLEGVPAPVRLDVTTLSEAAVLSPVLGQTFFVGDGRDDAGDVQRFDVPAHATALYLGFVDAYWFGSAPGDSRGALPGSYDDNEGALTVGVTSVPAPGGVALALGALTGLARRKRAARG
jgi:hypothetical protein